MPQGKDNAHYTRSVLRCCQVFLQKTCLSISLFAKNELFNHAGAAAFFFIVSIPPVILLLVIALDHLLVSYTQVSAILFEFIKNIHENLDKDFLLKIGLLNLKPTAIGIFGLLNLLWAGRAILTSIQRGMGVIFPEKSRPPLETTIFSFLILTVLMAASVLITFAIIGLKFFQHLLETDRLVQPLLQPLLPLFRQSIPFLIFVLLIFLAYRFVPPRRPKTASSFFSAVGCALTIYLIHILFSKFFSVTQYNVIYGLLGSLILMVLWVYFSFLLFFFFAEFTFVTDSLEVLVLDKMFLFRIRQNIKGRKIEKSLFNHPKWIFEKYAKRFHPGDIIFREGDRSSSIYFVEQGFIGLLQAIDGNEHKIATIGEHSIFGTTAHLLNEPRNTTAIAETDSLVLVIPPDIFEELLQVNPSLSKDIIELLCERLRSLASSRS